MNAFDVSLLALVAFSTLFAFVRGVVRELISIVTWIAAFVLAIGYAGTAAELFAKLDITPVARHVLAFALILIAALIVGAVVSTLLSRAVRAIGLGFVDRLLGAVFGVVRGIIVVVAFALVAGVTALPKQDWWQNSMLAPYLAEIALSLRGYLPKAWADRLDFSPAGSVSATADVCRAGEAGETESCAES